MNPMRNATRANCGVALLEILLAIAIVILLVQFIPSLQSLVDVRGWSQLHWIAVNAILLTVLLGMRFIPELVTDFREKRQQAAAHQARSRKSQASKAHRLEMEQRMCSHKRRKF